MLPTQVHAAHLCYLIAGLKPESAAASSTRLVLVGGDHRRNRRCFVTPHAVQRSEIVEFALKSQTPPVHFYNGFFSLLLFGDNYFAFQVDIREIQIFKFVYTLWLVEIGKLDQALCYLEHISEVVRKSARAKASTGYQFPPGFLNQLSSLEERIRTQLIFHSCNAELDALFSFVQENILENRKKRESQKKSCQAWFQAFLQELVNF